MTTAETKTKKKNEIKLLKASSEKSMAMGRRKESTARVQIFNGTGIIQINKRAITEYFGRPTLEMIARQPLEAMSLNAKVDVIANVRGGGLSGQAGAVRHAIARALLHFDVSLRPLLKKNGYLTRDPRMKERKKYGQKGARKRFQFSKR